MVVSLDKRIVTEFPIEELWTDAEVMEAFREQHLGVEEISSLLGNEKKPRFVIADPGKKLEWVADADTFTLWKTELKAHIVDPPGESIIPEDYPDGYCFLASEWSGADGNVIIVLEKYH